MKTLIVDDDFTSRLLLQAFLAPYGECHIAVNGKEAVEAFRVAIEGGAPYNLICMDILMPEMGGKEAVREVRQLEETRGVFPSNGTKIIMTTGVTDIKEVMRSFREVCDAYLVKPINTGDLLSHLKSFQLLN